LISDAVAMSQALTSTKNQSVQVTQPPVPLTLRVDATRITQVLCNLLHNAAKFSSAGATIELSVRLDAGALVFMVKDFGKGIPADQLEQIFTTFVQLDDPGKAQTGLGLGLSLARRLIALHGGTVEARSDGMGLGSEFEVRLPAECVVSKPAPAGSLALQDPGRVQAAVVLSILVVDDHQEVARAVAALLTMDGHRVMTAGNGTAALKAAAANWLDVVILDISLPDMNGHDIANALRQSASDRVPKIIAMTGWAANPAGLEGAAFDAYLIKPVSYEALNRTISAVRSLDTIA
jgi:CheY-like chemotaxis protein